MTNFVNIRKKSQNIRFILRFLNWKVVLLLALLLALMCSCKTYIPVETVKTETERVVDVQRDSIYIQDSVYIYTKADTVYATKWRTVYKEALRVDTFYIVKIDTFQVHRVDSVQTVVEVEKKLTKWQQTKMDVGAGVLYAVLILIAVGIFILYRKMKK